MDIREQISCVEREIAMRKRAYPKWVRSGTLKPEKAEQEIAAMEAVLQTLKRLTTEETESLFDLTPCAVKQENV